MKFSIALLMVFSLSALATPDSSEIACFSDMTDGVCHVTETKDSYLGKCDIEVNVQYKSGEKELLILTGTSTIRKNQYVLFLETQQRDRAVSVANSDLYRKIVPFLSIEGCK